MTMVYLANVPSVETDMGIEFYTPHAHASLDYPCEGNPNHFVLTHWGPIERSREFVSLADALDFIAKILKVSEQA